jgi:aryl-alcohol dehydrogenase-like predicted oxidoreductase
MRIPSRDRGDNSDFRFSPIHPGDCLARQRGSGGASPSQILAQSSTTPPTQTKSDTARYSGEGNPPDESRLRIGEAVTELAGEIGRPASQVALNWLRQRQTHAALCKLTTI